MANAAPTSKPPRLPGRRMLVRVVVVLAAIACLGVWIARLDLRPDLSHLRVAMLSGPREGNYHAIVDRLAAAAGKRRGAIGNMASEGSVDNVARLAAAARDCNVHFALVQAGTRWPEGGQLSLVARLARAESMFVLGKNGDAVSDFASLRGLRVGIGPEGSGTAYVSRQVLESRDFAGLGLRLSTHPIGEQLELAAKGDLDLAIFVMDEDAAFIENAVRERGLAIAGFPHADVVARRFPFLSHGRIGAGQYDPVRMLPPVDKRVLRVDTLVIENGCAGRSGTMGLLTALSDVFPEIVRHNKDAANTSGLELSPHAKSFFDSGGPELLDQYLPRLSSVMPPSNWVHLVMGISVLFNLMGLANRFVLWRIDAARVRLEQEIARFFGPAMTLGEIARMEPEGARLGSATGREIDRVVAALQDLAARSRRLSLSVLVPMGQEMAYRYQENLIHETIAVLRGFRGRWTEAREARGSPSAAPPAVSSADD